jgi:hypothetical protein
MKQFNQLLAPVLFALAGGTTPLWAVTIQNGSFETPLVPADCGCALYAPFPLVVALALSAGARPCRERLNLL